MYLTLRDLRPELRNVSKVSDILWISNGQIPPFFGQLAHFVSVENVGISTPLLYPILESSGLNQQILCAIWSLCNQVYILQSSFMSGYSNYSDSSWSTELSGTFCLSCSRWERPAESDHFN